MMPGAAIPKWTLYGKAKPNVNWILKGNLTCAPGPTVGIIKNYLQFNTRQGRNAIVPDLRNLFIIFCPTVCWALNGVQCSFLLFWFLINRYQKPKANMSYVVHLKLWESDFRVDLLAFEISEQIALKLMPN